MDLNKYEDTIDKTFNVLNTVYEAGRRIGRVFLGLFFFIVGAGVLIYGYHWFSERISSLNSYILTEGTVTEIKEQRDSESDGFIYAPIITFNDNSGKEYKYYSDNFSYPPSYHKGEKVEIYYDSANPNEAFINSFIEKWVIGMVLLILGVVFVPIGIWLAVSGFKKDH